MICVYAIVLADTARPVKHKVCGYAIFHGESANGEAMRVKDNERDWAERTQRFVKAELKRADVTYEELATKLREMGLRETKVSIASKLSRAGFSASFFVAVMKAIGRESVNLSDV
jgi:hypothetical protein